MEDLTIIIHSPWEGASRDLVDALPENHGCIIIDWFKDHAIPGHVCTCVNGQPYEGPDPSAFPELVWYDADPPDQIVYDEEGNETGSTPVSPGWVRIRAATSLEKDISKIDARKADD